MSNPIRFLRRIALVEGVSFLVLLGIALPLRRYAGMPGAVTVCGWIHGVLFLAFCFALLRVRRTEGWKADRLVPVLIAGLLPFGPFVFDRRIERWERGA